MNAYKHIIATSVLAVIMQIIAAQPSEFQVTDSLVSDKDFIQSGELQGFSCLSDQKNNRIPLKMNYYAGTGFSWTGLYGSGQGIYAGADGSMKISQRFRVSAGSFVRFSRYSHMPSFSASEPGVSFSSFNHATLGFYAKGDYLLTPKLTLTGIAFKEFSPFQNEHINPMFLNSNREGVSFQLNYRILENLHFGARFDYIKNDQPYSIYRNRSVIDNYFW
ncbi:MAG: hypothetical protein JXB00_00350 [Bacteroidales bacterium]|nr:hypothetical protein [Bacteroidales bacterium]